MTEVKDEDINVMLGKAYNEKNLHKKAVLFQVAWFNAENCNLGSFQDKMELCKLTEYYSRKALGEDVGEYKGVPRISLKFK